MSIWLNNMEIFQPTPPHRGRHGLTCEECPYCEISTHAPAQGATQDREIHSQIKTFQPTPPAQGATDRVRKGGVTVRFQPTPPAQGATLSILLCNNIGHISTHAPRTGGDKSFFNAFEPLWSKSTQEPAQWATYK